MVNRAKALVNKGTCLRTHTQLLAVLAEYRAPDLQGNALCSFHVTTSWGLIYKWVISGQLRREDGEKIWIQKVLFQTTDEAADV